MPDSFLPGQLSLFSPRVLEVGERDNRRAAVLHRLWDGRWHTTAEINSAACGGTEGTRRLRELRAKGHVIEKRRKTGSVQYEYRLRRDAPSHTEGDLTTLEA